MAADRRLFAAEAVETEHLAQQCQGVGRVDGRGQRRTRHGEGQAHQLAMVATGNGCGDREAHLVESETKFTVSPTAHVHYIQQDCLVVHIRSEEHTSELQSLMRISYAVFCLKKKKKNHTR